MISSNPQEIFVEEESCYRDRRVFPQLYYYSVFFVSYVL